MPGIEANEKANEMNKRLKRQLSLTCLPVSITEQVCIRRLKSLKSSISVTSGGMDVGLMFIDLDNFKHYNDTYVMMWEI